MTRGFFKKIYNYSMASHQELVTEWTMLDANYNNWTVEDLQVAAELGRTLLERNEELENDVKSQQAIIDDQAQEIEFLTKQNNAMKEESVTRAKFYEQLESTIFELERTNTQLTRKHDSDKKRIRSLCENIDYLERKCEEMTSTLETIRDENKKHYGGGAGKMSRNGYWSSNGSDSSEDDSYMFYKRRSHSLQDLRDYTPSPDEFDSHNSHSPELKASEAEFIESLESKIEELMAGKKKELEKVHQLEAQMRILIQENANLQEQLNTLQTEKEDEISELRKQLLDTSNYAQQTLSLSSRLSSLSSRILEDAPEHSSSSNSGSEGSPVPICSSTFNHGDSTGCGDDKCQQRPSAFHNYQSANVHPTPPQPTSVVCKRCSAEINLLNLVNSIESENDPEEMDVGEFSSLEHELARATGRDRLDGYHNGNGNRRKLGSTGSSSPDRNDAWNYWGMRRPSLLDYFLFGGRDEEVGEEACETQVDYQKMQTNSSSTAAARRLSRRETAEDDEDPCLRKDRQSEKEKDGCDATRMNQLPVKKLKLPVKIPYEDESTTTTLVEEAEPLRSGQCDDDVKSTRKNAIKSDSHDFCDNKILVNDIVDGVVLCGESEATSGSSEDQVDCAGKSGKSSNKKSSKRKTGLVREEVGIEELPAAELSAILPPVSVYLTPASPIGSDAPEDMVNEEEEEEEGGNADAMDETASASTSSSLKTKVKQDGQEQLEEDNSNNVPEYKQILTTMFNLFHNSRRTYPTPVYHMISHARR